MSMFAFVKEAGVKLWESLVGQEAQAAESLKEHVAKVGLGNPNIEVSVEGDKVTARGEVASQEEKEKILLALGNVAGVAEVEDQLLLRDVARLDVESFDGTQWLAQWDTTDVLGTTTNLPVAVRIRLQRGVSWGPDPGLVELLVPMSAQTRTNSTSTVGG